ncbi:MAG: hypothetical protein CL743_06345 [Chloroflexi bacterium]|nr:hypothetical protein [Chloroflexota bacterium]HCH35279.1 hypothetical protein [Dehalococcoidia bacterium]
MQSPFNLKELYSFTKNPRSKPTYLGYTNGFAYGFSLNALQLLVALYAIDLGFDMSKMGIIIAAPAFFMVALRLPGGAISDRFGEKVILRFSFVTLVICGVIAAYSSTLWPLIIAQLFNGASRSVYWSAGQSYISRSSPGDAGKVMGRQLSFESAGGIIGAIIAGYCAEFFDYKTAFIMASVAAIVGFSITSSLPALPRKDQVRKFLASFAPAREMLFKRSLLHAHMVAFMAASYAGLMGGLFIAFFREVGYGEGETSIIRSLNSIGLTVLAYVFGTILAKLGSRNTALIGITLTGALSIGIAASGDLPIIPIVLMTVSGMTFGSLRALYPSLAAQNSTDSQRAMALSVVSLYWAIAMLLSPLVFGFIANSTSITFALFTFGGFSIIAGLLSPLLYLYGRKGITPSTDQ